MNQSSFKLYYKFFEIKDILEEVSIIKKGPIQYLNVSAAFDIETSSFYIDTKKQATMYAWALGINGKCIRGRTWDDFLEALYTIKQYYGLSKSRRIIIYVHNLAYEFQWFRRYFEWTKVFSLEDRRPIYCITEGIEFRCSYLLANLSLEKVGDNLIKYPVKKQVGDLDYRKIRHSKTPLTSKEWNYLLCDILVVMSYIQELIEKYTLIEIPITNTGFVRKFCREQCLKGVYRYEYNKLMKELTLESEEYLFARQAFMGGFTHANPNYVSQIIENVSSYDFTSSYPTVMLSEMYPMGKGIKYKPTSKQDFIQKLNMFCCLIDVEFFEIGSIIEYDHYISKSKCIIIEDAILDNGRVVGAAKLRICLTEQDFRIITKVYEWEKMALHNMYIYKKGYLPKPMVEAVVKFYKDKTELKGVLGKEEEYLESKGRINSLYGMCVTDICRDEHLYEHGWNTTKADVNNSIENYNKSPNRFLSYLWGVWITAYARANLWSGILEFKNDYIYSDTDSLKVINIDKHKNYIDNYNQTIIKKLKTCLKYYKIDTINIGAYTIKNKYKVLGVWDFECTYSRFKTLGAKRYMYELDNEMQITISGVSKKYGLEYLKYEYKTNDAIFLAFQDGLDFPAEYKVKNKIYSGTNKLTHTYIDEPMVGTVIDYKGMPLEYEEQTGVHLEPTGYSLSLDYAFVTFIRSIGGDIYIKK